MMKAKKKILYFMDIYIYKILAKIKVVTIL